VARGDLALEMSFEDVPIAQKRIIAACRRAGVPVITATQMLESMITDHKPTRAEAADVANAILDGTDAVMLSAESAVGNFPAEAVSTMATIAVRTERAWLNAELPGLTPLPESADLDAAVGQAAQMIARSVSARAIIAATTSGSTPRRVASHRPRIPVIALGAREQTCRRMALIWGVEPVLAPAPSGTAHLVRLSAEAASSVLKAQGDDVLTIVAGTPYNVPGRTNLIKVETVSDALRAEATRPGE
jgi:pyruvate kinase